MDGMVRHHQLKDWDPKRTRSPGGYLHTHTQPPPRISAPGKDLVDGRPLLRVPPGGDGVGVHAHRQVALVVLPARARRAPRGLRREPSPEEDAEEGGGGAGGGLAGGGGGGRRWI